MTPDIRSKALRLRIRDFECEFLLDTTSCVPLLEIEIMEKCIRLPQKLFSFYKEIIDAQHSLFYITLLKYV